PVSCLNASFCADPLRWRFACAPASGAEERFDISNAVPQPRENDSGSFVPRLRDGDVDQARFAFRVFRKPALVVERSNIFSEGSSEELIEIHFRNQDKAK